MSIEQWLMIVNICCVIFNLVLYFLLQRDVSNTTIQSAEARHFALRAEEYRDQCATYMNFMKSESQENKRYKTTPRDG